MINLAYHKGEFCQINSILCQEGYCSECMIYMERSLASKSTTSKVSRNNNNKNESRGLELTATKFQ